VNEKGDQGASLTLTSLVCRTHAMTTLIHDLLHPKYLGDGDTISEQTRKLFQHLYSKEKNTKHECL